MNYNVEIKIDNIRNFSKDIVNKGNNVLGILDNIIKDLDELGLMFDTPTGKLFEEKIRTMLIEKKNYIEQKYIPYHEVIDKVVRIYEETTSDISKSIDGNDI